VVGDDVSIGEGCILNGNKVYPHRALKDFSGRDGEVIT
jgi:hypothetical protein